MSEFTPLENIITSVLETWGTHAYEHEAMLPEWSWRCVLDIGLPFMRVLETSSTITDNKFLKPQGFVGVEHIQLVQKDGRCITPYYNPADRLMGDCCKNKSFRCSCKTGCSGCKNAVYIEETANGEGFEISGEKGNYKSAKIRYYGIPTGERGFLQIPYYAANCVEAYLELRLAKINKRKYQTERRQNMMGEVQYYQAIYDKALFSARADMKKDPSRLNSINATWVNLSSPMYSAFRCRAFTR